MVKDNKLDYEIGDKIFAKLKGFPHWPARIIGFQTESKNKLKYKVEFFGDKTITTVGHDSICSYFENKHKYGVFKTDNLRNQKFNHALKEADLYPDVTSQNHISSNNSINEALQKIQNCGQTEELDVETSLSLAAEVGNSLLSANSQLEEEVTLLKIENSNLTFQIYSLKKEISENINESEEELKVREESVRSLMEKNNNLEQEMNFFKRKFDSEVKLKEEIIQTAEKERNSFMKRLDIIYKNKTALESQVTELKRQISNLEMTINDKEVRTTADNRQTSLVLLGNEWMQDESISLYFNCLMQSKLTKNTYFMTPALSHAIKCLSGEDADLIIQPLELIKKSYRVIPINNAESTTNGSHWSLPFFNKMENTFYYLDSDKLHNLQHEREIVTKLKNYVCPAEEAQLNIVDCPQQSNSYDCGTYLLIFVDALISKTTGQLSA